MADIAEETNIQAILQRFFVQIVQKIDSLEDHVNKKLEDFSKNNPSKPPLECVGDSDCTSVSEFSSISSRRSSYNGEYKDRCVQDFEIYLQESHLTDEETLRLLPDFLKPYPGLVRSAFSSEKNGCFSVDEFSIFQKLCSMVSEVTVKKRLNVRGDPAAETNPNRKAFLFYVDHFNRATFYGRYLLYQLF